MNEMTVAMPLSGEEVVEAYLEEHRRKLFRDCHLNPALAYGSFEAHSTTRIILRDQSREEIVEYEIHLADRPPNVVRQASGQPIPTLVEDASGRKEIKPVKYSMRATDQGPGGTQQDPSKQQEQNPHRPGTPEHEKHEKERKEREEKEKKQSGQR